MKRRILLIDNDKLLNKINEKVLIEAGVVKELHIALSGTEAVEYLTSRIEKNYPLPEIIIFDPFALKTGGFTFLDQFYQLNFSGKTNIEIVVFTASSNPKDKQKAFERGVRHYLTKPYILRGLMDILNRLQPGRFATNTIL